MKNNNMIIIASYFDFILSTHLIKPYNQNLLLQKYETFDFQFFTETLTTNFIKDGSIDVYQTVDYQYHKSYAISLFNFILQEKNINIKSLKSFINKFSKINNKFVLKSGDNLYYSFFKKNHLQTLDVVNGCSIIRPLHYIINNFKNTNCLVEAINITKIINNHPYEIIATYLLYISITYLNKTNNPYKLFKILTKSLEDISDTHYKLILGDFKPEIFDKYKLEITANIDEFVRIIYGNFKNIPSERTDISDMAYFSKGYYIFISKIINSNHKYRQRLICNNGVSVLVVAINLYVQYYYYFKELNFVPLQSIISNLVNILGYSHHSTIILSYFISLLDSNKFIEKIPKNILNKITSQ